MEGLHHSKIMTTTTIITGNLDFYTNTYGANNNDDWTDLGSSPYQTWSNWLQWNSSPTSLQIRLDDDMGSSAVRLPLLTISAVGNLAITLKVSATGVFAGEETTYTVTTTPQAVIGGRYYRWTVTVTQDSSALMPQITNFLTEYLSIYETVELSKVDTSTLSGSISGRVVSHNLGTVFNVQLTTHEDTAWVDRYYSLPDSFSVSEIGPVASVTSTSPLTIVLKDMFGVPVNGYVDISIVGVPKIFLTATGVTRA